MTESDNVDANVRRAFEQLDYDFDRLTGSVPDTLEQRSALEGVVGVIYRLREHIKSEAATSDLYYADAEADPRGKVFEGIVALRGKLVHTMVENLGPTPQPLYPGEDVFPGQHTFPGSNLTWLPSADQAIASVLSNAQRERYKAIEGQIVGYTIEEARDFAWRSTHMGR
jgi:hypothetical protein